MKYDSKLMLQLVELVENKTVKDVLSISQIQLPDVSRAQLIEPLQLLIEAHLIVGTVHYADDRVSEVWLTDLTPKARKFIEFTRNKEWWGNFLRDARDDGAGRVTREGFLMALMSHFPTYP